MIDFDPSGNMTDPDIFSKQIYVPGLVYNRDRKHRLAKGCDYYQMAISLASGGKETPSYVPEWNNHFVFAQEMRSFTPETSLIIEYYREPSVISSHDPINQTNDFAVDFDDPAIGRSIDDLFGFSCIPLGDFSMLPVTESGKVLNLDKTKVTFVGRYAGIPGTGNILCKLDTRVPDNWHHLRPTSAASADSSSERIIPHVEAIV